MFPASEIDWGRGGWGGERGRSDGGGVEGRGLAQRKENFINPGLSHHRLAKSNGINRDVSIFGSWRGFPNDDIDFRVTKENNEVVTNATRGLDRRDREEKRERKATKSKTKETDTTTN